MLFVALGLPAGAVGVAWPHMRASLGAPLASLGLLLAAWTIAYFVASASSGPGTVVTVLIPEFFVDHWWQHLLHNQSALVLKGRLLFRKGIVVTSIPYASDSLQPRRRRAASDRLQ